MKALNLQEAKSVQTVGEVEKSWQDEKYRERLNNQESQYRALAARTNTSPRTARTDIQYAVKERCGVMSNRSLGRPRSVWSFEFQDADWAGCRKTARSTSGGAFSRGRHTLKTWSHPEG